MRKIAILALLVACAPWGAAQRAGAGFAHVSRGVPTRPSPGLSSAMATRPNFAALRRMYGRGPFGDLLSSFGIFGDSLGDFSGNNPSAAAAPNIFLLPSSVSSQMPEEPARPPAQPLMIELQGTRYVRVTNSDMNGEENGPANYAGAQVPGQKQSPEISRGPMETSKSSRVIDSKPAAVADQLPPTILIYRDGHSESVRDYAIADGVIYARGNFYTDGFWNKKIEVSALNVPQTVESNHARGVTFLLPGAPNEVVTRP
ncbi:MAG TPA: hypothetical protein VI386_00870 [Candidatus Sulfotelmatobacter sp.]